MRPESGRHKVFRVNRVYDRRVGAIRFSGLSLADRKKELMAFFTQWAELACKSDGAALPAVPIAKGRISQLTDDAGVGSVVPACNPPTEKNQRQRRLEPSRVYAPTSKSHKRLSNSSKRKKKEKKQKERDDALKSP